MSSTAWAHARDDEPESAGAEPFSLTLTYSLTRSFAPQHPIYSPVSAAAPSNAVASAPGALVLRPSQPLADGADLTPATDPHAPLITRSVAALAEWEIAKDLYLRSLLSYSANNHLADPSFGAEYDHVIESGTEAIFAGTLSVPLPANRVDGQYLLSTLILSAGIEKDWTHFGFETSLVTVRSLHGRRTVMSTVATGAIFEGDAYLGSRSEWKLFTTMSYLYPGGTALNPVRPTLGAGLAYLFD